MRAVAGVGAVRAEGGQNLLAKVEVAAGAGGGSTAVAPITTTQVGHASTAAVVVDIGGIEGAIALVVVVVVTASQATAVRNAGVGHP